MALIIALPIEIKHMINFYSEPYICEKCHRYGFEQVVNITNKKYTACTQCYFKCCCCDMYVDNHGTFFRISDKYNMKRKARTMAINKKATYCDGTKCRYCDKMVCLFCVNEITMHDYLCISHSPTSRMESPDKVTMHYSCNNCTNKCKRCSGLIDKYIFAYNEQGIQYCALCDSNVENFYKCDKCQLCNKCFDMSF